jgi:glycosyltransferase involved in cell wall biosynthesis
MRTRLEPNADPGARSSSPVRARSGCRDHAGRLRALAPVEYVRRVTAKSCVVVPAFDATASVGRVVEGLRGTLDLPVVVVDDGSTDTTFDEARRSGAHVIRHDRNRGKGAAILTGIAEASRLGCDRALTVDADGQHPADAARTVMFASEDPLALVLGVRDLVRDGAPRANRVGNEVSNLFLSRFASRVLMDTQCGLRRYPVQTTLDLGVRARGYAFEAEVILRAIAAQVPVIEVPVSVVYPPPGEARSHFRRVRDPARIVFAVLRTVLELRVRGRCSNVESAA